MWGSWGKTFPAYFLTVVVTAKFLFGWNTHTQSNYLWCTIHVMVYIVLCLLRAHMYMITFRICHLRCLYHSGFLWVSNLLAGCLEGASLSVQHPILGKALLPSVARGDFVGARRRFWQSTNSKLFSNIAKAHTKCDGVCLRLDRLCLREHVDERK